MRRSRRRASPARRPGRRAGRCARRSSCWSAPAGGGAVAPAPEQAPALALASLPWPAPLADRWPAAPERPAAPPCGAALRAGRPRPRWSRPTEGWSRPPWRSSGCRRPRHPWRRRRPAGCPRRPRGPRRAQAPARGGLPAPRAPGEPAPRLSEPGPEGRVVAPMPLTPALRSGAAGAEPRMPAAPAAPPARPPAAIPRATDAATTAAGGAAGSRAGARRAGGVLVAAVGAAGHVGAGLVARDLAAGRTSGGRSGVGVGCGGSPIVVGGRRRVGGPSGAPAVGVARTVGVARLGRPGVPGVPGVVGEVGPRAVTPPRAATRARGTSCLGSGSPWISFITGLAAYSWSIVLKGLARVVLVHLLVAAGTSPCRCCSCPCAVVLLGGGLRARQWALGLGGRLVHRARQPDAVVGLDRLQHGPLGETQRGRPLGHVRGLGVQLGRR